MDHTAVINAGMWFLLALCSYVAMYLLVKEALKPR